MIYRPFAPKALGDIDATDLARLISDQIPEGLFVEYKRDWTQEERHAPSLPSRTIPGAGRSSSGLKPTSCFRSALSDFRTRVTSKNGSLAP
jgi:hypothetical protein